MSGISCRSPKKSNFIITFHQHAECISRVIFAMVKCTKQRPRVTWFLLITQTNSHTNLKMRRKCDETNPKSWPNQTIFNTLLHSIVKQRMAMVSYIHIRLVDWVPAFDCSASGSYECSLISRIFVFHFCKDLNNWKKKNKWFSLIGWFVRHLASSICQLLTNIACFCCDLVDLISPFHFLRFAVHIPTAFRLFRFYCVFLTNMHSINSEFPGKQEIAVNASHWNANRYSDCANHIDCSVGGRELNPAFPRNR